MRHRMGMTLGITALCAVLAAGCSSSGGDDSGGGSGGGDEVKTMPWPLTGLPGYTEADSAQAITVKIENTEAGRPQVGIGSADIVVQELVEGGLTRLAVIFNSQYPDAAGPVRSMRETDVGIVLPTGGTLAASGGAGSTVAQIEQAGVPLAVEGSTGFSRDPNRRSPYNVMLNVAELAASLAPAPPPQSYFTFGEVPSDATPAPAASLNLRWPSSSSAFAWDAANSKWVRSDLPDATGFDFTNVIALNLQVTSAGRTDAAGSSVPIMETTGSGSGHLATAGQVYPVSWSKESLSAPWVLTYQPATGEPKAFNVPPGRTWLGLLPQQGGSFTSTPPEPAPAPAP